MKKWYIVPFCAGSLNQLSWCYCAYHAEFNHDRPSSLHKIFCISPRSGPVCTSIQPNVEFNKEMLRNITVSKLLKIFHFIGRELNLFGVKFVYFISEYCSTKVRRCQRRLPPALSLIRKNNRKCTACVWVCSRILVLVWTLWCLYLKITLDSKLIYWIGWNA